MDITWIGHATVLLRVGDLTILTDPVLSNRVGVGLGLITGGPHRLIAPALSVRELPPIDLILVSHAHFDHLDRPTLCRLPKETPVITAHHTLDLIRDLGFRRIAELQWGESIEVSGVNITTGSGAVEFTHAAATDTGSVTVDSLAPDATATGFNMLWSVWSAPNWGPGTRAVL